MKRWDVINQVIRKFDYKKYLEIGTWMGECIVQIQAPIRHGVDPGDKPTKADDCKGKWAPAKRQLLENPQMYFGDGVERKAGDAFFPMTSDYFFDELEAAIHYTRDDKPAYMRPGFYDFVFIDGDHTQVQSLQDFVNAFRWMQINGTIMLHDSLPPAEKNARVDGMDNGEVWKTVAILSCTRPDLEIVTVDIDMGCTLISKIPHRKLYVDDRRRPLSQCLTWEYFVEHGKEMLNVVSFDEFMSEYIMTSTAERLMPKLEGV